MAPVRQKGGREQMIKARFALPQNWNDCICGERKVNSKEGNGQQKAHQSGLLALPRGSPPKIIIITTITIYSKLK